MYGGVAQLGEHLPCKQGVRGSNPLISTPKSSSVTHLENRIYDNLAECIKFERMRCTRRIGYAGIPKERPDGCDEMGVSA